MRILHTSDWHLGQEFHGHSRDFEHDQFLNWLSTTLVEQQVDALVVAGDIYDSQNPPITAQRQLFRFIADIRKQLPDLDIVLVGGNHDSAGRLEAPGPLLETMGVSVVGCLSRNLDGSMDLDRLMVPLFDKSGQQRAICAAVPYLRQADLPPAPSDENIDPLVWGVRQVYAQVLEAAQNKLGPHQHLIATGHCYMTGCELSELSERRILGGNQHALPVDIFPDYVSYAALGHLHKAQKVGGRDGVRYSGSPFPLSVSERNYRHQVILVDLATDQPIITPLPVPRVVDVIRVPATGSLSPDDALAALRALKVPKTLPRSQWPYVHVAITADAPVPSLRRDIEEALAPQGLRLAKIEKTNPTLVVLAPKSLPDLEEVHPEEVFKKCWQANFETDPTPEALDAFHELLEGLTKDEVVK